MSDSEASVMECPTCEGDDFLFCIYCEIDVCSYIDCMETHLRTDCDFYDLKKKDKKKVFCKCGMFAQFSCKDCEISLKLPPMCKECAEEHVCVLPPDDDAKLLEDWVSPSKPDSPQRTSKRRHD